MYYINTDCYFIVIKDIKKYCKLLYLIITKYPKCSQYEIELSIIHNFMFVKKILNRYVQ